MHFTFPGRGRRHRGHQAGGRGPRRRELHIIADKGVRWVASFAPRSRVRMGDDIEIVVDVSGCTTSTPRPARRSAADRHHPGPATRRGGFRQGDSHPRARPWSSPGGERLPLVVQTATPVGIDGSGSMPPATLDRAPVNNFFERRAVGDRTMRDGEWPGRPRCWASNDHRDDQLLVAIALVRRARNRRRRGPGSSPRRERGAAPRKRTIRRTKLCSSSSTSSQIQGVVRRGRRDGVAGSTPSSVAIDARAPDVRRSRKPMAARTRSVSPSSTVLIAPVGGFPLG